MLKSKESKEAEIFECLSRDDSFTFNDMENLGPWHKYGGSIHQELQRISSLKLGKSVSEHQSDKIIGSNMQIAQMQSGRRFSQEIIKQTQLPLDEKIVKSASIHQESRSRTQLFKQLRSPKPKENSLITTKQEETQTNHIKQEKTNVGFFVQCYPNRNKFERSKLSNFQSSKEYFEKITLKMMYGLNRMQNDETTQNTNLNQQFIRQQEQQERTSQTRKAPKTVSRNYFYKKELKFHSSNTSQINLNKSINNSINSLLNQPQNIPKSRIPFNKIINKKTVISFASHNQLLEKQYQQSQIQNNKVQRMVSS
ncbi:unnamed protein product (macronuclear) [Paramecium tetraurelia]|uniref:Uncharacterized protein n=1 Tax=Paramecium tetraurelia TaxID=5888 RepID=A0CLX5_PARTE|nr:uncharacterized protein GSPATT00008271001 [Paramecium tetraurelia]CAK71792.1 unnamed protein product [Paramecium tetraurelia]|eukprot:XP_001439189.1 hypothetical protein (macronuclear) [Paramecium tetraurelia strain d4-2]